MNGRAYSLRGRIVRWVLARRQATIVHMVLPEARRDLEVIRQTRERVPMLVPDIAALELLAHARAARSLGHAMAEAGVYAGGSARLLCEVKGDLPLHLFDVFDTLSTRSVARDASPIAAEVERGFGSVHPPLAGVSRLLAPYRHVHIHAGLFSEQALALAQARFSLVHLDLDFEAGTRQALEFFYPRICPGGRLIGDDYNLPAVRDAFDAFFANLPDARVALPWGQVVVVKA